MAPRVPFRDLEACRTSNEALLDEEVAARVRAAVLGNFQPEQVNGFPMKSEEGYYDLVSPSSYCHSTLVLGFVISFPIFLRLVLVLPRGDRCSILKASSEGG
jgi:hypothetical protein